MCTVVVSGYFMHVSNIALSNVNRYSIINISTSVDIFGLNSTESYIIRDNVIYINGNLHSTYSIELNGIIVSVEAEKKTELIYANCQGKCLNASSNVQKINLFKLIYNDTLTQTYENLIPIKYIYNDTVSIILDNNYSAAIVYMTLTL
jgi:hypothetical protein